MWKLIFGWLVKLVFWLILMGIGIWYLSSSIGGASLSYSSMDGFLRAIGACNGDVCDIAAANGCFLCRYIGDLFGMIGTTAESFWAAMLNFIWILLGIGFGIYLFVHTGKTMLAANKKNAAADTGKLDWKEWFDGDGGVKNQLIRILIVGGIIGAVSYFGTDILKIITDVTVRPVMYVGSELAMASTGIVSAASCGGGAAAEGIMGPALQPLMCIIGNLNAVILAGAAAGFSLMNYAWMGLGGGLFTWLAGMGLLIIFLYIGFNIFFDILTIIFQLVFVIIFLPLFIASAAFKGTWKLMDGVLGNGVSMLADCAIRVVGVSLKTVIIYAIVAVSATENGFDSILVGGLMDGGAVQMEIPQGKQEVAQVFSTCEARSKDSDGLVDEDLFKNCFLAEKARVEAMYPGSFDFMDDGWDLILTFAGIYALYFYCLKDKLDGMLKGKDKNGFDFGDKVKDWGQTLWNIPKKMTGWLVGKMK
ncbi:MAG: hypothetical protein LBO08_01060 [Rickettsiales bacterium]|jgi:hypothetical protein|nr:hypothetical protein [Rickettsiales bacterium]